MRRAAWRRAALRPNGKLLEVARGLGHSLEESVGAADVDLADIARTLGGAGLLDEVEVAVSPTVAKFKVPTHS